MPDRGDGMVVSRSEFSVLANNPGLVYLDSACTSLKPNSVIDAEMSYYKELGACAGRSSHRLGIRTNEKVEEARGKVSGFVCAKAEELVWTRNTTEGLNIIAQSFDFSEKKKVVTSVMEHHSALLPFMRLRDKGKIKLEIVNCDESGTTGMEEWTEKIDNETALIVTHSWNNTSGTGNDTKQLAKLAHDNGALICIDGAQGVPHHKTDFRRDNLDFLCFSGHKMLGPTGIGALVAKKELLAKLDPPLVGGGTVKTVSLDKIVPLQDQTRFEAGVQHYSGMLGFAAACDYLRKIGIEKIEAHEKVLAKALLEALDGAGAIVYGPKTNINLANSNSKQGALFSFNLKNAKPHDVALMLDRENIAVRSGFFCAQPALEALGAKDGAVRASGYIYNTLEDVRKFGDALQKLGQLYG